MEDLKAIIAKNIIDLRKSMNLTQAELAEKLNYSDKAVSKWERAESIPDIIIIKRIADLFHVTVDYLLTADHADDAKSLHIVTKLMRRNRLVITLLSTALVFLIATILFVFFGIYFASLHNSLWMIYILAIPVACIVLLVFNTIWGRHKLNYAIITALLWSVLLCVYLIFLPYNIRLIFILGIPAQIIIILWANLNFKHK